MNLCLTRAPCTWKFDIFVVLERARGKSLEKICTFLIFRLQNVFFIFLLIFYWLFNDFLIFLIFSWFFLFLMFSCDLPLGRERRDDPYTSLCNFSLPCNNQSLKTAKIPALKGLNKGAWVAELLDTLLEVQSQSKVSFSAFLALSFLIVLCCRYVVGWKEEQQRNESILSNRSIDL